MTEHSEAHAEPESLSGGATRADYMALLKNRDFRGLMLATVTSTAGDWIGVLAILALTRDILGPTRAAAFAMGGVMAVRVIPALVLGPMAGVFVDRWNRKRVLIATDIARGIVMALIPFTNEIFSLVLATLLIELLSTMFAPAKDSVFPRLVAPRHLIAANQVNLVVTYGTLPLGALFYGALTSLAVAVSGEVGFLGERPMALPIWFNAASYLISAPLIASMRVPPEMQGRKRAEIDPDAPGAWEEFKEGLRFIGTHPVMRALIVGVMIAFVSAGVVMSIGELFARILNAGQAGFGWLVAVVGTGLAIGLVASGPLTERLAKERLFAPGIGVAGGALIVTALMPRIELAMVTGLIMGLGAGLSFIVGYSTLQERADDAIRGRTFAAFHSGVRAAILGATVAGPTLVGILGIESATDDIFDYQFGGVRLTLVVAGVLAVIGSVVTGRWLAQALRELEGPPGMTMPVDDPSVPDGTRRGALIVLEGGDGAGKTTQLRRLADAVESAGHDVLVTREPGGTELGERVRELLLDADAEVAPRSEALLYAAARAQHVDEVIAPALQAGTVVLCDRFTDSSVVYQGGARGLGEAPVGELNRWATGGLHPDLTILLDVDPEIGLGRAGASPDRLEAAGLDFHRTVNATFRTLAGDAPERYLVLDASLPADRIAATIRDEVLERLGPPRPPADALAASARTEDADVEDADGGDRPAAGGDRSGTDDRGTAADGDRAAGDGDHQAADGVEHRDGHDAAGTGDAPRTAGPAGTEANGAPRTAELPPHRAPDVPTTELPESGPERE